MNDEQVAVIVAALTIIRWTLIWICMVLGAICGIMLAILEAQP